MFGVFAVSVDILHKTEERFVGATLAVAYPSGRGVRHRKQTTEKVSSEFLIV